MAENNDDILEEAATQEEEPAKKKGLTPSLLIKIAIGLLIVLLALIAAFFLLPGDEAVEADKTDTAQSQVELIEDAQPVPADAVDKPQTGSIELPDVFEQSSEDSTTSADSAAVAAMAVPAQAAVSKPLASPDKVLAELVALQQQIANLQEENQGLIKRVQDLAKENETLKTQVSQLSASKPSTESVINDQQLVNTGDIPLYYRQNRYDDSKQIELKPKWGDED